MEWKIRLRLRDSRVFAGGYVGTTYGEVHVADELSGEIHSFPHSDIEDFDVRKY